MAKKLPDHSWDTFRPGRSRYPWGEWLDGDAWLLEKGKDYTRDNDSFRVAVHQAAKSRGMGVMTETTPEGNMIVQAVKQEI